MLTSLRSEQIEGFELFELILFSSKNNRSDLEIIGESIEKACSTSGNKEKIFDLYIGMEDLSYINGMEVYILDLNIFLGAVNQAN